MRTRRFTSDAGWSGIAIMAGVIFGAFALLGPTAALALLAGSMVFVLMVRFPVLVIVVVYLGITFANSGLLSFQFGTVWTTAKVAMVGGIVAWFVHAVSSQQRVARLSGMGIPLAISLMSMVMAYSWARSPAPGTFQEMTGYAGLLIMVLFIDTILKPQHLIGMHRFFAVVIIGIVLYDLFFAVADPMVLGPRRAMGVFDDPNFWCAFLLIVGPPSMVALEIDDTWSSRIMLVALMGLVPMSVVASLSRGGLLTLVLISPFVLYLLRRRWPLLLVAAVGGLILASMIIDTAAVYERYFSLTDVAAMETDGSIRDRTLSQMFAWDLFTSQPLFGWGTGSFAHESMVRSNGSVDIASHNTYLRVLAEQGLLGAVANISVLAYTAYKLYHAYRESTTRRLRMWVIALMASMLAFMASAGLLNMIAFGMSFFYLGIIVGVCRFVRLPLETLEAAGLTDPGEVDRIRAAEAEAAEQPEVLVRHSRAG